MPDIKLSVVVPVYKTKEQLLRKCLDSLVTNNRKIEVILVDDGTPDNGGTICDKYANKYENIVAYHQNNQGVSIARNQGISMSNGKYIFFADADDISNIEIYDEVAALMDEDELDVCVFKYRRDTAFCHIKKPSLNIIDLNENKKNLLYAIASQNEPMEGYCFGAPWGKAFRKGFLIENNIRFFDDLRKMQDRVFMLYCIQANPKIATVDLEGYCYIKNENSIVNKYNPQMGDYLLNVAREIQKFNGMYEQFSDVQENTIISKLILEYLSIVTLHKDNPNSIKDRAQNLKKYSNIPVYSKAIKNPDYKKFTQNDKYKLKMLKLHLYKEIIFASKYLARREG